MDAHNEYDCSKPVTLRNYIFTVRQRVMATPPVENEPEIELINTQQEEDKMNTV